MGVVEELIRAREAYGRREWLAAYDGLSDAAPDELAADDFVRLATAAYLLGRRNDCVQALQRAYQLNLDAGDTLAAVRSAFWLALVLLTSGETAIGGGWVARSQRLLAEADGDVVERGYLLIHLMYRHIFAGEFAAAYELAEQIAGYGHRYRDPDLIAMGLSSQGRLLLYGGRVPEGLALLDESMVGVAAGEVSTIFAGNIYCSMIEACQEIADFDRAARWTAALTTWCAQQPGLVPFTGQCAVHRGQIMRAQGAFDEALTEFDLAVQRYLADQAPGPAGLAMAERGDVLRIRGDLTGAQAAYERAVAFGHEPQPGLALLWLAQGRTEAAVAAIRRLLGEAADRSTARNCCRPRWRCCWPPISTTRPPPSPPSSNPSRARSAARRCRHAPTTPPHWSRSSPVTRRPRCRCCGRPAPSGSGWAGGTRPRDAACSSAGRCAPSATRSPRSPNWRPHGAASPNWAPRRPSRRPPR